MDWVFLKASKIYINSTIFIIFMGKKKTTSSPWELNVQTESQASLFFPHDGCCDLMPKCWIG